MREEAGAQQGQDLHPHPASWNARKVNHTRKATASQSRRGDSVFLYLYQMCASYPGSRIGALRAVVVTRTRYGCLASLTWKNLEVGEARVTNVCSRTRMRDNNQGARSPGGGRSGPLRCGDSWRGPCGVPSCSRLSRQKSSPPEAPAIQTPASIARKPTLFFAM